MLSDLAEEAWDVESACKECKDDLTEVQNKFNEMFKLL